MNDDFWAPRRSFATPIPEIYEAARLLEAALRAHGEGDRTLAAELIVKADMKTLYHWAQGFLEAGSSEILRLREVAGLPAELPKDAQVPVRMPGASERRDILERDGWHCRFCGMPVIEARVREAIRKAYPDALRWSRFNAERHSAFLCMWLQYDHVLPHSRGGGNSLDNVVIACAPCNFARGNLCIEQVGILDPRQRPVNPSSWNGLTGFLKPSRSV